MSAMPSKEAVGSLGAIRKPTNCRAVRNSVSGRIAFVPLTGVRVFEIGVVAYVNSAKRAGCSRYIQDHLELKAAGPDHDAV